MFQHQGRGQPLPHQSFANPQFVPFNQTHGFNGNIVPPMGLPGGLLATPPGAMRAFAVPPLGVPSPDFQVEEALPDPRLDDPWLQDFVKTNIPSSSISWLPSDVKARLREVKDIIEKLKSIHAELLKPNLTPSQKQSLYKQGQQFKDQIESLTSSFKADDPNYIKFKYKFFKSRRHKIWFAKQKEKAKKIKAQRVEKLAEMHKTIDEWQAKVNNEDQLRRKAEEEKKKRLQELREEKQLELTATHFSEVLLKLEELRALRANNMELEGQSAPSTPSLYEILKAYLKDHPIEEKKKRREEVHDITMPTAPESEAEASTAEGNAPKPKSTMTEEIVRAYYDQASHSLEKLIDIRRAWDIFLYPRGRGGTRIPLGPVLPPRPSPGWEQFLKQPKKKKTKRGGAAEGAGDINVDSGPTA